MTRKQKDIGAQHVCGDADHFKNAGAPEFLEILGALRAQEFDVFWKRWHLYQLVIWADHNGWEFEARRARGPRGGNLLCIILSMLIKSQREAIVRTSRTDLLDLGYLGRIWIFAHEPHDLLWPMTCQCDKGRRWTQDPDYINRTSSVRGCELTRVRCQPSVNIQICHLFTSTQCIAGLWPSAG